MVVIQPVTSGESSPTPTLTSETVYLLPKPRPKKEREATSSGESPPTKKSSASTQIKDEDPNSLGAQSQEKMKGRADAEKRMTPSHCMGCNVQLLPGFTICYRCAADGKHMHNGSKMVPDSEIQPEDPY